MATKRHTCLRMTTFANMECPTCHGPKPASRQICASCFNELYPKRWEVTAEWDDGTGQTNIVTATSKRKAIAILRKRIGKDARTASFCADEL